MAGDDGCDACRFSEVEPNGDADEATQLSFGQPLLANVNSGVDWFRIDVQQGNAYRVRLLPRGADTCADIQAASLLLQVHNGRSAGTSVFFTSADTPLADCLWYQWVVAGADGERFLSVQGSGANVDYRILVEELVVDADGDDDLVSCAVPDGSFCGPAEIEPNNTEATATPIALGVPAIGTVTVGDDDYYSVMATDDDPLLVEVFVGEEDACGSDGLVDRLRLRGEVFGGGVEASYDVAGLGDCEVMVIVTNNGVATFRVDVPGAVLEDVGPYAVLVSRYTDVP
jgi:hypothetical protein